MQRFFTWITVLTMCIFYLQAGKDSILRSKKRETLSSEWVSALTGFLKVWQDVENDLSVSLTWHILTNSPHRRDKSTQSGPKTRSSCIGVLQEDFRLIKAPSWTRARSKRPETDNWKSKTAFSFICACNTSSLTAATESNVSLNLQLKLFPVNKNRAWWDDRVSPTASGSFAMEEFAAIRRGLSDTRRRLKCHTTISHNYTTSLAAGNRPLLQERRRSWIYNVTGET